MYKHGKPVYRLTRRPLVVIVAIVILLAAGGYYFVIRPNTQDSITQNTTARVTTIKSSSTNDTQTGGDNFVVTLPGPWKLSSTDNDARYHSYQWVSADRLNNGRQFNVYEDRLPQDLAVNYLLPIKVQDNAMVMGNVSDNCVNFTEGASPLDNRPKSIPVSLEAVKSRWQSVDFWCNNGNIQRQLVGASSSEAVNTISLSGPTKGQHKFFFTYQDNNISPDYGLMEKILATFKVK